jgi:hypothetical protein
MKFIDLLRKKKILVFYIIVYFWCVVLFGFITPHLNVFFRNTFFSGYHLVVKEASFNSDVLGSIFVAPIVEETLKMSVYLILFLGSYRFFKDKYESRDLFINRHLVFFFLLSTFMFGFMEGIINNANAVKFGMVSFYSYVLLNIYIHTTYSFYPFILGKNFRYCFVCFLPIGILLHAVHNLVINVFWDDKWLTFIFVTFLLFPFIILERKNIVNFFGRYMNCFKTVKQKVIFIYSILIISYIFILISVMYYGNKLLF